MKNAVRNAEWLSIDLTPVERMALNPGAAISLFNPEHWAARLGYATAQDFLDDANRLTGAIAGRARLSFRDWCRAIDIVSAFMSPRNSEWQTVVGIDYLETAAALVAITHKVDLAFGGTIMNPAPRIPT